MAEQGEVDDLSSHDNLNDEYDVTWGGRVSRYLYNYTLQLSDESEIDSDQTESIYSMQSKETMAIVSESDLSSNCCASDCDCQSSNDVEFEEYEVLSSSYSPCNNDYHFSSSDSSTTLDDLEIPKLIKICNNTLLDSDNGYFPDDTDVMITNSNIDVPPPACFRKCVQCRKENPNPYFQYCHMCFSYRKEFFVNKPKPKPKSVKRLSMLNRLKKRNLFKYSQISKISNSPQSDSMDMSQGENNISTNIEHATENLCNICFTMPKNGIFNHGKISHICFCYTCAIEFKKKNDRCPVCNVKVTNVNKMITV